MSNRLPASEVLLENALVRHLEASGRRGAERRELDRPLAGDWSESEIEAALDRLQRQGVAVEWNRRWYAVSETEWTVGQIQPLARGDALVATGAGGEAGYFVAARNLKGAGDGDSVLLRPARKSRGRAGRYPEALVVKILARRFEVLVGALATREGRRRFVPFDMRFKDEVEVQGAAGIEDGHWLVASPLPRGSRSGVLRATVEEVLGPTEEPGVDVQVVLRHYRIPDRFPDAVLEEAAALPEDPAPADWEGREDLRQATVVTIDGETARDFDDAITVERLSAGRGFLLGVHIADVSHYVPEGGVLDLEAYRRGTSVYFPDRAIPMLPERLSNGLCSLRPGVPRLTQSVFIEVAADGRLRRRRFCDTVIESSRRLTYSEVRRILEEPRQSDRDEYGAEVLALLREGRRLMEQLLAARLARGSIDFDLPEGDVILDPLGFPVGVRPGERTVAHRMIEEFMILANEAVAAELAGHDCAALFRIHDPPSPARLEELRFLLRPLGLDLPDEPDTLHPRALQEVLRAVEGREEEPFVATLVLRAMQRAIYHPEDRGHFALGAAHYTHFTSPIRRYPDLLVHRRLRALRTGDAAEQAEATGLAQRLAALAEHTSATERRAERSEREIVRWKLVRLQADRVGERMRGHITGVKKFGLFVLLEDFYVDGLVPIRTLTDDYYVYDAEGHRLVGERAGRVFQLADAVEIVLESIDPLARSLDLRIADMPPAAPRRARRGRPRRPPRRRGPGA